MIPATDALLILWNDYSGDEADYNAWHTREHVLERLTLPGFVSARRYVRECGPLAQYMTLYWLSAPAALQSSEYSKLLNSPSRWSLTMREGFENVMRRGCANVIRAGHGIGGEVAVKLCKEKQVAQTALTNFMDKPAGLSMNSFTLAAFDAELPDLPFTAEAPVENNSPTAFLMVESFDQEMLTGLLPELDAEISQTASPTNPWTRYRLAYVVGEEEAATRGFSPKETRHAVLG